MGINFYTVNHNDISVSTAITIIQIKAGALVPLQITEIHLSQKSSTTSTWQRVQLLRKTGAATVTSFTPLKENPNDPTANAAGSTTGTGITASGEGTDGDILMNKVWNWLTPFDWQWNGVFGTGNFWVPAAGIIALKFPTAPAAANFTAYIKFAEAG